MSLFEREGSAVSEKSEVASGDASGAQESEARYLEVPGDGNRSLMVLISRVTERQQRTRVNERAHSSSRLPWVFSRRTSARNRRRRDSRRRARTGRAAFLDRWWSERDSR